MCTFLPFKAVRPQAHLAHLVASRSYITYSKKALTAKLSENPFTFVHIIYPEFSKSHKPKDLSEKHQMVSYAYHQFLSDEILVKDTIPQFYIYRQSVGHHDFTGIIGGAHVADYLNGRIKIHEKTITKREALFTQYLSEVGFNAEPVLLTYPQGEVDVLDDFIQDYIQKHPPQIDFSTTDRHRHTLWPVNQADQIALIEKLTLDIPNFYIADGHHRSASSALLAQQNGLEHNAPYQAFMSLLVPERHLQIHPFHRMVKDLKGLSLAEMLEQLQPHFHITPLLEWRKPEHKFEFILYTNTQIFSLEVKQPSFKAGVEGLSPEILSNLILSPVLGISDLRTDKRIAFVGGPNGAQQVIDAINNGQYEMGFLLYAVSVKEMIEVADLNQIMPPKSTWVEPKLRSGLTIYELT